MIFFSFCRSVKLFLSQATSFAFCFWLSSPSHQHGEWQRGHMVLCCQLGLNHDAYGGVALFSLTWKSWFCSYFFWMFSLIVSFADGTELQYSLCRMELIYVLSRFTYAHHIFIPEWASYLSMLNAFEKSQRSVERNCKNKNSGVIKCSCCYE